MNEITVGGVGMITPDGKIFVHNEAKTEGLYGTADNGVFYNGDLNLVGTYSMTKQADGSGNDDGYINIDEEDQGGCFIVSSF